jgi:hypothetical protein
MAWWWRLLCGAIGVETGSQLTGRKINWKKGELQILYCNRNRYLQLNSCRGESNLHGDVSRCTSRVGLRIRPNGGQPQSVLLQSGSALCKVCP